MALQLVLYFCVGVILGGEETVCVGWGVGMVGELLLNENVY